MIDVELLKECVVDILRSWTVQVRITHVPTGVTADGEHYLSQYLAVQQALEKLRAALRSRTGEPVTQILGPFTILCNYCGKSFGQVDEETWVAASAVLKCPCGNETKFENMRGY